MGKRLYVGNLPYSATDEALQSIFAQAGTVTSAKVIMDRATGRSKGFGFVEMSTEQEAAESVTKFNGADYDGRTITVAEARPPETGGRGGGGGFGGGGGGGRGDRGGRGGGGGDRGGRGDRGGGGGGRY